MNRSDIFLSTFNKIEKYFEEKLNSNRYLSFYQKIDKMKRFNKAVRQYEMELKDYANLRNVIVHERIDNKIIAEPNEYAVNQLSRIYNSINNPKKVFDIIKNEVVTFNTKDSLGELLDIIKDKDISQIPIYTGEKFIGLLNSETIISWLVNSYENDLISLKDTMIRDVMKFDNEFFIPKFVSRKTTVFDIIDIYQKSALKNQRLEAIIVTENGNPNEKPLTIITDWDLPKIIKHIEKDNSL